MSDPPRLRRARYAQPDIATTPRGGPHGELRGGLHGGPGEPARRARAERRGRRAETYAALRLRMKGWRILARRVRTARGEIDLIARRGTVLAFVEVKARARMAEAERAITPHQQARIAAAAELWLNQAVARDPELAHIEHRFDAVLVAGPRLRHVPDAWRMGDA